MRLHLCSILALLLLYSPTLWADEDGEKKKRIAQLNAIGKAAYQYAQLRKKLPYFDAPKTEAGKKGVQLLVDDGHLEEDQVKDILNGTFEVAGFFFRVPLFPRKPLLLIRNAKPFKDNTYHLFLTNRRTSSIAASTKAKANKALSVFLPDLYLARLLIEKNEAKAVEKLKSLVKAENQYLEKTKPKRYGTLEQLMTMFKSLDPKVKGYELKLTAGIAAKSPVFQITASPLTPGKTGKRSFFVDQRGIIRYSFKEAAHAKSPAIGESAIK